MVHSYELDRLDALLGQVGGFFLQVGEVLYEELMPESEGVELQGVAAHDENDGQGLELAFLTS